MRITLLEPVSRDGNASFALDGTHCVGLWRGRSQPAGVRLDIELTIEDSFAWEQLDLDGEPGAPLSLDGLDIRIRGVIEDIDDDGMLTVRVSQGLVMIETIGSPPDRNPVGRRIGLTTSTLEIYPVGS